MAVSNVAGERRKHLGAFYTPPALVNALTTWAIRTSADRILEPASGEAAFLLAALRRLRELGVQTPLEAVLGVEVDAAALAATRQLLNREGEACHVLHRDFFDLAPSETGPFTVVIGNPPYVRYHRFRGDARERGLIAAAAGGVTLTGLASSWAPFVVHASRFLGPEGRLGFVLPAELLHVDYAEAIRNFLLRRFASVSVVTFETSVFPGAMIDTVLLMAEGGERRGLRVVRLRDTSELAPLAEGAPFHVGQSTRWSSLLAPSDGARVLERLRERGKLQRLGAVASVDIGFVTGANDFFLIDRAETKRRSLPLRLFQAAVARPGQLRGAILSPADGTDLIASEHCLVLSVGAPGLDQRDTALGRYLRHGKRLGVHRGYKCQARSPWYRVPGIRIPDAFMSYMSSVTPRVALNEAGFSSSNLVHQLNFHLTEKASVRAYIAALHSSVAMLSFEMEGRSYGGGVLKHETREAERIVFPFDVAISKRLTEVLPDVDHALREEGHEAAAEIVDDVLVRAGLMTRSDLEAVGASRRQLHARRAMRGRTSA